MDEKKNVSVNITNVMLKEVKFVRAEQIGFERYKINVADKVNVDNVANDGFKISYSREITNNDPFYAIVTFDVYLSLNEDGTNVFGGDLNKIKEFAEKRKNDIVINLSLPARASLLIGNMTKEVGSVPLIMNPNLAIKNN